MNVIIKAVSVSHVQTVEFALVNTIMKAQSVLHALMDILVVIANVSLFPAPTHIHFLLSIQCLSTFTLLFKCFLSMPMSFSGVKIISMQQDNWQMSLSFRICRHKDM